MFLYIWKRRILTNDKNIFNDTTRNENFSRFRIRVRIFLRKVKNKESVTFFLLKKEIRTRIRKRKKISLLVVWLKIFLSCISILRFQDGVILSDGWTSLYENDFSRS